MKPPLRDLQEAIASEIAEERAYNVEDMCKYFGLQEKVSGEDWGTKSKKWYVISLIKRQNEAFLISLAVKVQEYYQSENLKTILNKYVGGVSGQIKNIIFAANGPKPEIILSDAMHNDIAIVENEEYCLVYDKPITSKGLLWRDLIVWWQDKNPDINDKIDKNLYKRLRLSLGSKPEKFLFSTYYTEFGEILNEQLPALIPQVYFYYDPKTLKELEGKKRLPLPVQRMDFLILFSDKDRVIIEIDGKHHYSNKERVFIKVDGSYRCVDKDIASPKNYATMMSEDRKLCLRGYEMYRFGGFEICTSDGNGQIVIKETAKEDIKEFFSNLFNKHGIVLEKDI